MDQQNFDFQHDEDRFIHHQLDEQQYQSLIDLMATLINHCFPNPKTLLLSGYKPRIERGTRCGQG